MMITIPVQHTVPTTEKTGFGTAFGIELYKLKPICRAIGNERDMVALAHGVGNRHKVFVFHLFTGYLVFVIFLFDFQSRQSDTAAGNHGRAGGVKNVSTDGADV